MKGRREQHYKGKKRLRVWHHGRRQGKANDRSLERAEQAFERAAEERERTARAVERTREEVRDYRELVAALEHAAPFVPRLEAEL